MFGKALPLVVVCSVAAVCLSVASAATITVDEWTVGVIVETPDDRLYDATNDISNPFNALLTIAAPPAFSASATHAFSWSDSAASFHIDAELEVPDQQTTSQSGRSISSGAIYFTAEEDLLLSMGAALHYDFPPHEFSAYLIANVRELNPTSSLLRVFKFADSSDYVQTSGTLTASAEGLPLSAGRQYKVDYSLRMTSFGDGTDAVATGDGHIQFTLLPVPEPTAALLLLAATIPAIARRCRRMRPEGLPESCHGSSEIGASRSSEGPWLQA